MNAFDEGRHSSLFIEGNALDLKQVTAILDEKRILGPQKDIAEVQNAIKVYDRLFTYRSTSLTDFLKAHKALMQGLVKKPGCFRGRQVGIVKGKNVQQIAPGFERVNGLMKDLFAYVQNDEDMVLIKSCVFHYEMEFIHPFEDRNGRMGRLWQTRLLMEVHPIFEFVPVEEGIRHHQKEYYKALSDSDRQGKSTLFIEFMLTLILEELLKTIEESKAPVFDFRARTEFLKEMGKAWFDRKEYMKICKGISTATASRDLRQMLEEGFIEARGSGRVTEYRKRQERHGRCGYRNQVPV